MPHRILIVDDEPFILESLEDELSDYAVLTAATGEEALAVVRAGGVDLVISDVRMPGRDGVALLEEVRAVDPSVARILLTAYPDTHATEAAMREDGAYKLRKPWGDELLVVVKRALESRDARIAHRRRLEAVFDGLAPEATAARDLDPVRIVDRTLEAVGLVQSATRAAVYLSDAGGELALVGTRDARGGGIPVTWEGYARDALEAGTRLVRLGPGFRFAAPLAHGARTLGVALVEMDEVSEEDCRYIETVTAQAALLMEAARLNRELADRERRLQQTRDQLVESEKLAALGRLLGGIAHEINNPLCGIGNEVQLLLIDRDRLDAETVRALESVLGNVDRIDEIVKKFLRFVRREVEQCEPHGVNDIISGALRLVRDHKDYRRVRFDVKQDPDLPAVVCDATQIQQVILNILQNARDAMPGGGSVRIRSHRNDAAVEIVLSDTGPGVPEDIQGKIFEPLFTTKEPGQGTGLGLSVSREIVRSVGGELRYADGPEGGATFVVRLPIAGPKAVGRRRAG